MLQTFPLAPAQSTVAAPSQAAALTLLGPSPSMASLWSQIRRLAPYARAVTLNGKPDCGQEAVARLLLELSPHSYRAFLRLTAAELESRHLGPGGLPALPTDILLFIPDAHLLSSGAQHALLRLMRQRRARAFTVVVAGAYDLRMLVSEGQMLPALAEALTTVRLTLPTLQERGEDIPMLLNSIISVMSAAAHQAPPRLTEAFLGACGQYPWPENLREMTEVVEWMLKHLPNRDLDAEQLQLALAVRNDVNHSASSVRLVPMETVVQEHLSAVLKACAGNKLKAAEVLGISRSTLYRMLGHGSAGYGASGFTPPMAHGSAASLLPALPMLGSRV